MQLEYNGVLLELEIKAVVIERSGLLPEFQRAVGSNLPGRAPDRHSPISTVRLTCIATALEGKA